jgi:hypothetical protein
MSEDKSPLIPSLLYTQGSEEVKKEVEDELKVPDPSPDAALAFIREAEKDTSKPEDCKKRV